MVASWRSSAVTRRVALGGLAAGVAGAWGCNPRKDQIRPDNLLGRIGGPQGEVIEPKKCALRMAVVSRPFRDPLVNEVIWRAADEQAITHEERRALQANGVRLGRIVGDLPRELEALFTAPPPDKIEPVTFLVPEGTQELLTLSDEVDQASLLLSVDGRINGKDYDNARAHYRVTPEHYGAGAVALRLTPEIHFGPTQRSYQALQQPTPYAPQEFKIADGQRQESFRDLAARLIVEPGQAIAIGCIPEQERSLGAFLFMASSEHLDQRTQRAVLIWADRNQLGVAEARKQPAIPADDDGPTPADDEFAR
jgi:hypothetical protein